MCDAMVYGTSAIASGTSSASFCRPGDDATHVLEIHGVQDRFVPYDGDVNINGV
jgi:poly(3-hydroxybutyrate) depolymerase